MKAGKEGYSFIFITFQTKEFMVIIVMEKRDILGHSKNDTGQTELLVDHLSETARYAVNFGRDLNIAEEALYTALLHDLGKYGIFQDKMYGKRRHADHWTFGAHQAFNLKNISNDKKIPLNVFAAAFAIQGHHTGLGTFGKGFCTDCLKNNLTLLPGLELSQPDSEDDFRRFLKSMPIDPQSIIIPEENICTFKRIISLNEHAPIMADLRMLYSILVDADFLATEGHFRAVEGEKYYHRTSAPSLNPELCLNLLLKRIEELRENTTGASKEVRQMRSDLLNWCLNAADNDIGNFTLTAPTGSGKTLAMLAFALKHAIKHHLDRIIVVIPFLSIIEQTADIYRSIFGNDPTFVLEDHSRARGGASGKGPGCNNDENEREYQAELAAENWDAPIVITTSVQFFESLHSNRPGACRKLHRLANCVILFDEVQSLPKDLAIPTLATLSRLPERYRTTLVMATATQPAFFALDPMVKKYASGWQTKEIVGLGDDDNNAVLRLFQASKRTNVHLDSLKKTSWCDIAEKMVQCKRALCIVNLKRHAHLLIDELARLLPRDSNNTPLGVWHLSTSMCPKHREDTLDAVRNELKKDNDTPVLLVATQCVEAGVDIDFPVVWRAMAPLDAIAQAAGRCNRNARSKNLGEVFVFYPELDSGKSLYPTNSYGQGVSVAETILKKKNLIPIEDPNLYIQYFKELYSISGISNSPSKKSELILGGIEVLDFPGVANNYRLIDNDTINVLVPYAPNKDRSRFDGLLKQVRDFGLSGDWMRSARDFTVSLYKSDEINYNGFLEPLPLPNRWRNANLGNAKNDETKLYADDWFTLIDNHNDDNPFYHPLKGLCSSKSHDIIVL